MTSLHRLSADGGTPTRLSHSSVSWFIMYLSSPWRPVVHVTVTYNTHDNPFFSLPFRDYPTLSPWLPLPWLPYPLIILDFSFFDIPFPLPIHAWESSIVPLPISTFCHPPCRRQPGRYRRQKWIRRVPFRSFITFPRLLTCRWSFQCAYALFCLISSVAL